MQRTSTVVRISFALVGLLTCVLLGADCFGLLPDETGAVVRGRANLCESVGVNCLLAAQRGDLKTIAANMQMVKERNPELESVALRDASGNLRVEVGEHASQWPAGLEKSTATHMQVPISLNQTRWGTIELRFRPLDRAGPFGRFSSLTVLMVFVGAASFLGFYFYLRKVLHHLDPNNVIPQRVRATLDTLAEGLLVMDRDQRIVLANETFAETVGMSAEKLQGTAVGELRWALDKEENPAHHAASAFPWERCLTDGVVETERILKLDGIATGQHVFKVNASPISGDDGSHRGVLATFSDVTTLQIRNAQLADALDKLKHSRDQVRHQNEQLKALATRDPLTGCLNRRAFFEEFENQLGAAKRTGRPMSYAIVDIDRFKAINDNHGHAAGDEVLRLVAATVRRLSEGRGLVCRYGGEEFSVLLPTATIEDAAAFGETLRATIEGTTMADLRVTVSVGVAQFDVDAGNPREALEQADKALYAAKRNGRNQVMRWDQVPADATFRRESRCDEVPEEQVQTHIPFTAVTVLNSALYFRDPATALHSRRTADLCAATARGLMSEEQRYVLEVAALLHDIGKLGVPDAILLKPGQLTVEEQKIMQTYETMGFKILENAFTSPELAQLCRTSHAKFGGDPAKTDLPSGQDIPLGARILCIADAYDSMVTDHVYRKAMSQAEAFAELRRCAGTQFDPELVEWMINAITSSDSSRHTEVVEHVSKQAALQIGLQIEKLACALDAQNASTLKTMAGRLKNTAAANGIDEIAKRAQELEDLLKEDPEWLQVVNITGDLLELCRMTQRAQIDDGRAAPEAQPAPARASRPPVPAAAAQAAAASDSRGAPQVKAAPQSKAAPAVKAPPTGKPIRRDPKTPARPRK
jgi:diguanylate cyclase (GGDEF)-like protein/PAS domain S-box-containing protein